MAYDYSPCFNCRLPDCDLRSANCGLLRAANRYKYIRQQGDQGDCLRQQYNAWDRENRIERLAQKSERAA